MNTQHVSTGRGQKILAQMGQIPVIVQGKVSERRNREGKVTGCKLQRWRHGRNATQHIPAGLVETVREGTEGYAEFMKLAQEYVEVREAEALQGDCGKKKAHEAVEAWALELHRFVDTAAETLQSRDLGDITWLEHGLRDTSQGMCRDVLQWLLALPGLQVPGDCPQEGERRISGQQRIAHSLFGEIPLVRNYYHHPQNGHGRFPLDEALGLIDGYTPGVAALIGRCAAETPFGRAEESFRAYTGLTVQARQFPRLAEHIGPLVERCLRANLPSGEAKPPRVYVAVDGTGAPLRHEELRGRKGRQPDGTAQTHEIKVGAVFTQHPVADQKPWRDLDSNTYVATAQRSKAFGQMMRDEFIRRFPDPPAEVAFLGDGAPWIWELQRIFFPMSLGIVDFYHAAEHVTQVVDLVEDHHTPTGRKRRRRWVKLLLRGRLDTFLQQARAAIPSAKAAAGEKALNYFEKNRERMRYRYFQEHGYFIGSGVVEAACKTVVAQRMKGSGMHWSQQGLSHILSIRTAILSNRYDDLWREMQPLLCTA